MAPTTYPVPTNSPMEPDLLIHNCTLSRAATIVVITTLSILLLVSLCVNAIFLFRTHDTHVFSLPTDKLRKFSLSSTSAFSSSSPSSDEKDRRPRSRSRYLRAARDTKARLGNHFANRDFPQALESGPGAETTEIRRVEAAEPDVPPVPRIPVRALTKGEGMRARSLSSRGEERGLGTMVLRG